MHGSLQELLRYDDAEARSRVGVGPRMIGGRTDRAERPVKGEESAPCYRPLRKSPLELIGREQPRLARKSWHEGAGFCRADLGRLSGGSETQALAALGSTGADHGATSAGRHADEEAVRALAADDGWLIGALHDDNPLM